MSTPLEDAAHLLEAAKRLDLTDEDIAVACCITLGRLLADISYKCRADGPAMYETALATIRVAMQHRYGELLLLECEPGGNA